MTKEQILAVAIKKELTSRLARDCIDLISKEFDEFTEEDIADVANLMLDFINRPARQNIPYTGIRGQSTSAIMCNHANESPVFCDCSDDCYCKTHTCKKKSVRPKPKDIEILEFGGQSRER